MTSNPENATNRLGESFTGPDLVAPDPDETTQLVEKITSALTEGPAAAAQLAQQASRKESRRWYLLVMVVATCLSLVVSFVALDFGWQAHAQKAAWDVVQKRSMDNLTRIRAEITGINVKLAQQGKAQVPLPESPFEASARLAQAQTLLSLPTATTGKKGAKGDRGEPGPTCPSGTSLSKVTFADGQSGLGCVSGMAKSESPSTPMIPGG